MCGITMLWDEAIASSARLRLATAMADTIRHRGPDGHGAWCGPVSMGGAPPYPPPPVALAHRRLAIQGLGEQGAQPMVYSVHQGVARGVLTYNGELFDAADLRADLARGGVAFRGTSDTEILLHAIARWG